MVYCASVHGAATILDKYIRPGKCYESTFDLDGCSDALTPIRWLQRVAGDALIPMPIRWLQRQCVDADSMVSAAMR